MNDFGFDIQDLSGAELHKPLSSLGFDALDYTPFEQLLEYIRQLPPKRAKVSNKSLSANGVVVNDRMEKYLAHTGESSSLLKEALKSPRHYYISRLSEEQRPKVKNAKHFAYLLPSRLYCRFRSFTESAPKRSRTIPPVGNFTPP